MRAITTNKLNIFCVSFAISFLQCFRRPFFYTILEIRVLNKINKTNNDKHFSRPQFHAKLEISDE